MTPQLIPVEADLESKQMYLQFGAVLVFIILGVLFVIGNMLIGSLIRLARPDKDKISVYECGEPTIGSSWIRYNSRFYTVALVYLLFDVEVVVLIPAMLVLKDVTAAGMGGVALVALMIFIGLLALGLAYEWYWGNLDWIKKEAEAPAVETTPTVDRGGVAAAAAATSGTEAGV